MKNIFITGGAGYIGSHCAISLSKANYNPIILDNFSNSHLSVIKKIEKITGKKITFYKVNLLNKKKLKSIFEKNSCYAVIHCAGFKSVEESTNKPIDYFNNNIGSTLSLLDCMRKSGVFKIIFSSSATVYNEHQPLPFKENSKVGQTKNPYGNSKYIIERILIDLSKFDERWSVRIARYFNPISYHMTGKIKEEQKGIPSNLLPHILNVAQKKLPMLKIFGKNYKTKDGTAERDYIHIMDLANGHVEMLKNNILQKGLKIYNFGTGRPTSVLEIIEAFEKITGITIPFKYSKPRKGDIPRSFCSPKKALKELKWKSKFDINQSMKHAKKAYQL